MPKKRQRWTTGAVVVIPLCDGFHSYAQMLENPEYGFFDIRTKDEWSPEQMVVRPVLFRLWVMRYAHGGGRWQKIGNAPVTLILQQPVLRYNQDPLRLQDITLTNDGFKGPLASIEECESLECAAVWDPEHVEDRLRDHFAGVPNDWVRSLRPKVVSARRQIDKNGITKF